MSIFFSLSRTAFTTSGEATSARYTSATVVCDSLPIVIFSTASDGDFSRRSMSDRLVFTSSIKPSRGPRITVEVGGSAIARLSHFLTEHIR